LKVQEAFKAEGNKRYPIRSEVEHRADCRALAIKLLFFELQIVIKIYLEAFHALF